jgi:hypothetical protein
MELVNDSAQANCLRIQNPKWTVQISVVGTSRRSLRCTSPLLAQSRHPSRVAQCPLSGVKRTLHKRRREVAASPVPNLSFCEHRPERHESLVRHDSEQVTTIPVTR